VAGLAVLLIVGAFLAVQFGRQVYTNWEIGQRAAAVQAEIDAVEAKNALLQAELDYLLSDAYIGAEARRLSNIGARGERVLIIPPGAEAPRPEGLSETRESEPFLIQWMSLFFGDAR
jgi:cell division protein FtsB